VAGWGIDGAAWGHLAASLLFTCAFLAWVHGRTVPTSLATLLRHGYAPGCLGVAAVALVAFVAERRYDHGLAGFAAILAGTAALLALHGALFVLERGDGALAWSRVKACWPQAGRAR
jgi:hypothetical protein